jgi:hypothetical protein
MLKTNDAMTLRQQLDQFAVPVFVVDLFKNETEWRLPAINNPMSTNPASSWPV